MPCIFCLNRFDNFYQSCLTLTIWKDKNDDIDSKILQKSILHRHIDIINNLGTSDRHKKIIVNIH